MSKDQEQAKLRKRLEALLKLPGNQVCADCKKRGPRWASANLGIFFCIECSGIHRNLGVHISFVRSVNLDSWTEQQVAFMEEWGNDRANELYEANIPAHLVRPKEGDQVRVVEKFIREKYEQKKFMAKPGQVPAKKETVAAPAPVESNASSAFRRTSVASPSVAPVSFASKPAAQAPKPQTVDLLDFMGGGDSSSTSNTDAFSSGGNAFSADPFSSPPQVNNQASHNNSNNSDAFSGFLSAPTTVFSSPQQAVQQQQQQQPRQQNANDLFGDFSAPPTSQPPAAPPKPQVSPDAILSLYSQGGQQMGGMQGGFGGMNQMGGMNPQMYQGMPQQQGGFPMNPQMMGGQQMGGQQMGGMPQQQFRPNQPTQMNNGFNSFPGQQQQQQAPQQAAHNPFASFDQFKRA